MKKFTTIIKEAQKTFTVYKLDPNSRKLSNKEHLNNNELDEWMEKVKNKFSRILVVEDNSKKYIIYDRTQNKWKIVQKGKDIKSYLDSM